MATRKQADDKADDKAAVEERADGPIQVSPEGADAGAQVQLEEGDLDEETGKVVGEEVAANDRDRLVPVKTDEVTPGGPGDRKAASKDEKAFVLAAVTQPEVTSENPEEYSVEELNHRFNHVPPAGFEEHKITIQQ